MATKQHFVMLAHKYDSSKHCVGDWFVSEKLNGQRCIWDGGISRGHLKADVPWANTDKDERYVEEQRATGLWSRYGNVIHAPEWFLDGLPNHMLDGELYTSRWDGSLQELRNAVSTLTPDDESWRGVSYCIFDIPSWFDFVKPRTIDVPGFYKVIRERDCNTFAGDVKSRIRFHRPGRQYRDTVRVVERESANWPDFLKMVKQKQVPFIGAEDYLEGYLEGITEEGGEGLMLRSPISEWCTERTYNLLKMKKLQDSEATVIGYTSGRETDRGSKLLGMMGALLVRWWNGKKFVEFELSGFTDAERELEGYNGSTAEAWARSNPGILLLPAFSAKHFPRGSKVTFRYRDLSKYGVPQEARYWRKPDEC